ncbi:Eco57I restriction-modification methylase domain-containing protein [Dyadobacter sp. CY343]|uniref:type IIG restriction enzyme/methyltransferase n=1 Tax=Dyadobacter sp. CY343 TaxID=2907299 RepID=UPI001F3DB645|nr:TaqI-like C-terminal specificity domain-containing protein [Dyadobacter sp. CY343]MCE7061941.1 Eco57I restriction-modification methylase domain-containing protein [Dyadobacter sp. CY343]
MIFRPEKPKQSLNKAFLKQRPLRKDIDIFKFNLIRLLGKIDEIEREENQKNHIRDFLRDTFYKENHEINTKDSKDLVIHLGKTSKDNVGVIIEAKRPGNKSEMFSAEKFNTKSLHELILYYLNERYKAGNNELKQLVITNVYDWFIIDANHFDRVIYRNAKIKRLYETYRGDKKDTPFFYEEVSKILPLIESEIPVTHFDIREYKKVLLNEDKKDDRDLIALFKILSPHHLLKQPFANDSNSLDRSFYSELLHIIGLTEVKEKGKKIIQRPTLECRNNGSLLENTINQLDSLDKVNRLENPGIFGSNYEERLFNIGLELVITWINRILFLKLLEAQLISYHKDDESYAFLNFKMVKNFDDLNRLFFSVLARHQDNRIEEVKTVFRKVPYLNSSLFELTILENQSVVVSNLSDDRSLPIVSSTVLKDNFGRKRTGYLNTLEYLFAFLESYDFSSEGSEDIQEQNKTLINASVLGLIFEKINGYKDGSFFTPGFITMYMCRETIQRTVIHKINERLLKIDRVKNEPLQSLDDIYNVIGERISKNEVNEVINSIRICDPAVESGHFLVSALNEILFIKSRLKVLQDKEGLVLRGYHIEVENDELTIANDEGDAFEYKPHNRESQRIQETLFHEKQTIIENCLFGVDVNPNSVKICRLRLWIELLKNAYYKSDSQFTELETLPNIDINIKCGNSLISRFALDADLGQALRKSKWSIENYKEAVRTYRNAQSKEEKREMERLIENIKGNLRTEISRSSKEQKELIKFTKALNTKYLDDQLFTIRLTKAQQKDKKAIEQQIERYTSQIEEIRSNKIYVNAFEWRFEFPDVLNDEGDFLGFDAVIGNPPYVRQEQIIDQKPYLRSNYQTYAGTADLYVFFVERGLNILNDGGYFCYILPNKWMKGGYGGALRKFAGKLKTVKMIDFGDLPVFDEATTYPSVWLMKREYSEVNSLNAAIVDTLAFPNGIDFYLRNRWFNVSAESLTDESWNLVDFESQQVINKIKSVGKPLVKYINQDIYRGVLTGLNDAFVIDLETKNSLIAADPKSEEIIKPFLSGRDIRRYCNPVHDKWLLFVRRGIDNNRYPAVQKHLEKFRSSLEPMPKNWVGNDWKGRKEGTYKWYEIQDAVDYHAEFEKPKIFYQEIASYSTFAYDSTGLFSNNKLFFITCDDLALLGFLNSKLVWFYLKNTANVLRGALALQSPYILNLPLSDALRRNDRIIRLVTIILESKQNSPLRDTSLLESEIDLFIYALYNLSVEEIEIVERASVPF